MTTDGAGPDPAWLRGCIGFYCERCSRKFPVHLLYPAMGPGFREHQAECIGCEPPTPTFRHEGFELKPMEIPRMRILEVDSVRELKKTAGFLNITGMCQQESCSGTGQVYEDYDPEHEFQRGRKTECPRCKGSGFEPMEE